MFRALTRTLAGPEIHGILGLNRRNRELVDKLNPRRMRRFADDKVLAKELMVSHGLPVTRTYAVIDSMGDVGRIMDIVGNLEHFVIKPARGMAGGGIVILGPRTAGGWLDHHRNTWQDRDVRRRLGDILSGEFAKRIEDRALIEERVFPGSVLGDLPMLGLPDIRIITLFGNPVLGMIRLPTRKSSGKANLHLGAVGVGVDLTTGRTTSATWRSRRVTHHPETRQSLTGLPVAAWDRVLQVARATAGALPLDYLGVDISINQDQEPVVLEANVRPGLEIQNANQRGLRPHLERFLAGGDGKDPGHEA